MEIKIKFFIPQIPFIRNVIGNIFSLKTAIAISVLLIIIETLFPEIKDSIFQDFYILFSLAFPSIIFINHLRRNTWYLVLPVLILIFNLSFFAYGSSYLSGSNKVPLRSLLAFIQIETFILSVSLGCVYIFRLIKWIITYGNRKRNKTKGTNLKKSKNDHKIHFNLFNIKKSEINSKKIVFKLFIDVLVLVAVSFGIYTYKIHSLSLEGNKLFEYRCTHVNPILISYKNSFLKYADFLNSYPEEKYTQEEVIGFYVGYISGMKAYIPQEDKWLEMQKKYIDRWDFKLFEPWYVLEASVYQWKMYEGYRDDAKSILSLTTDQKSLENFKPGEVSEERKRRDMYIQKYFDFYQKASQIHDWRKSFGRVSSPPGCTKENTLIPDTTGSIKLDREPGDISPPVIPIDPYGLS